ncbi:hypothetical protein N7G274_005579 [Stereocaulon virgatum]|uniref:MINDY deubiquitinase domain-containing protein n=1 Tax=Stereocaulon virgatum TaxID=373712 RepID=A0ABR4A7L6_9LECA
MVVRKPVATALGQAAQGAPYPTTPISPRERRAKTSIPRSSTDFERYAAGIGNVDGSSGFNNGSPRWQGTNERIMKQELPPELAVGRGRQDAVGGCHEDLRAALKAGSVEVTPRSSWESQRSTKATANATPSATPQPLPAAPELLQGQRSRSTSNNPYRLMHNDGKAPERLENGADSSAEIWAGDILSSQSNKDSTPIWHPFAEPWMQFGTSPGDEVSEREAGHQWQDNVPQNGAGKGQITNFADQKASEAPELFVESPGLSRHQNSQPSSLGQEPLPSANGFRQNPLIPDTIADRSSSHFTNNVWNSFQTAPTASGHQRTKASGRSGRNDNQPSVDTAKIPILSPSNQDIPPPLPPRSSGEQQRMLPSQPPRPPKTDDASSEPRWADIESQTQREEAAKTRRARETYQIRLVNWYDASSPTNPRRSPVMVQNANGPCPLLALVNALVLSTPSGIATALVETLRVREQVSLGLLLDAVIDELMSGRRSDEGNLPDVTDLYAFLVTLHTGMNVNPRFVPVEEAVNLMDAPINGDLPTNLHGARQAGGFEDTREMKLYSTFAIPLIHGWIPPRNHPAFAALKRTARTYEDAQNVMFREEELEEKLRRQGLSQEEQMILEDIASIKYFLSTTATQLTGYGLDTMTETMAPGSIAILFRNDHFSTLYRHPRSGQLLTLVTDMGYAGHDEVVWESLVDVSGEGCEFFSGDFRPVGNVAGDTQQQQPSPEQEGDWTTVGRKSRRAPRSDAATSHSALPPLSTLNLNVDSTPLSPKTEQEDHDLALAMQLQEEEEEQDRQEAAARRREDELSQAYLNSSDVHGRRTFPGFGRGATGARGGPSPPPRGGGSGRHPPPRGAPRKSSSAESEDAPPPSYEQAAKGSAYVPPANSPANPYISTGPNNSKPRPTGQRQRQSSAYTEHATSFSGSSTHGTSPRQGHAPRRSTGGRGGADSGLSRRRSGPPGSAISLDEEKKEKECIVM